MEKKERGVGKEGTTSEPTSFQGHSCCGPGSGRCLVPLPKDPGMVCVCVCMCVCVCACVHVIQG